MGHELPGLFTARGIPVPAGFVRPFRPDRNQVRLCSDAEERPFAGVSREPPGRRAHGARNFVAGGVRVEMPRAVSTPGGNGENMGELSMNARLVNCFQVVFPNLPAEAIPSARQDSIEAWDSVAAITLISVIEDEFQVTVDLERLPELTSFSAILADLKAAHSEAK